MYTFTWEGSQQKAILLSKKKDSFIKFKWLETSDEEYFEFFIQIDELTSDVSLIVTDFADDEDDKEDASQLWNAQIDKLKSTIGS